jgi:hypothetical protein
MRWLSISLTFRGRPQFAGSPNRREPSAASVGRGFRGVDQPCDFVRYENAGQLVLLFWVRLKLAELMALWRAHENETGCANLTYSGWEGQLPLLQQTGAIGAKIIQLQIVL